MFAGRGFTLAVCGCLFLLCGSASAAEEKPAAKRWNFVMIVADDLGLQLGCYGDKQAKTPHIDSLASRGTTFTRAYTTVASCSPSRSVILSGLYIHASGQYGLAHATHHFSSYDSVRSLPVLLAENGYRTCSIGKTHVTPESVYHFETYANEGTQGARNTVRMAANAKEWIAKQDERPFFLYFCPTDPHRGGKGADFANGANYPGVTPVKFDPEKIVVPPWLPNEPEVREEWAAYYESVSRMDQGIGALMTALRETGHEKDTIVFFLSDNGPPFPNAKTSQYEPGMKLPLIVRVPDYVPETEDGDQRDTLVSWVDLAPTVLEFAGIKDLTGKLQPADVGSAAKKGPNAKPMLPAGYQMQGRSFAALFTEGSVKREDAVYGSHQFHEVTMYYPMRALIERRYKLIYNIAHPLEVPFASDLFESLTWQGVLKRNDPLVGNRKTSQFLHRPRFELYDLETDPHELNNLADDLAYQERLAGMKAKLKEWQQATKDPWLLKHDRE